MNQTQTGRRGALGATAVAGLALAAGAARAQSVSGPGNRLQDIIARGRLIVGTGSEIPPFFFRNEAGELAGMEVDLARLLAKGLFNDPAKVEFVVQTQDARIPNLLSGRVDAVIQNLTVTAARAQQVAFSIPYYRAGQGFLLRTDGRYKNFAEMRAAGAAVKVSAIQNVFAIEWVRAALPQAQVEQFPGADAAQQALDGGRVDAQFITDARIGWTVQQAPQRYRNSGHSFKANSIAVAVHPAEIRLHQWIDVALREMMLGVDFDGFAALYQRWLGVTLPQPKVGYPSEMIT
jgi:polar amino acid transport system substrate-binding protein